MPIDDALMLRYAAAFIDYAPYFASALLFRCRPRLLLLSRHYAGNRLNSVTPFITLIDYAYIATYYAMLRLCLPCIDDATLISCFSRRRHYAIRHFTLSLRQPPWRRFFLCRAVSLLRASSPPRQRGHARHAVTRGYAHRRFVIVIAHSHDIAMLPR